MGVCESAAQVPLVLDAHPEALEQFHAGPGTDDERMGPFRTVPDEVLLKPEAGADADTEIGIEPAVGTFLSKVYSLPLQSINHVHQLMRH